MREHGDVGVRSGQRMQQGRRLRRQDGVGHVGGHRAAEFAQQHRPARWRYELVQRLELLQDVVQVGEALLQHLGLV